MTQSKFTDKGFKGSGEVFVEIYIDDTTLGGAVPLGNCSIFEVTPESETEERISYLPESYGQSLERSDTAKPTKMKITGDDIQSENMAYALSSTLLRNNDASSGSVSNATYQAWKGQLINLKHLYVDSVVVKTPVAGTGTGYTTDDTGYAIGNKTITLISGTGTILAGDTVTFAGDTTLYAIASYTGGVATLVVGLKQAIPAAETAMTIRAGNATLSATTDYKQYKDYTNLLEVLDSGIIADGGTVVVSYNYKAVKRDTLLGGLASFSTRITMRGMNRQTGKWFYFQADKVMFTSAGSFNFLTQEFAKLEIEGTALISQDSNSRAYGKPFIVDNNLEPVI